MRPWRISLVVLTSLIARGGMTQTPADLERQKTQQQAGQGIVIGPDEQLFNQAQYAAAQVGLSFNAQSEEAMRSVASTCSQITTNSSYQAERRLLSYFSAKASGADHKTLSSEELADFSCDYLTNDFRFASARINFPEPVTLISLTSSGKVIDYSSEKNWKATVHPGNTIVFPVSFGARGTVWATTRSGSSVYWSGSIDSATIGPTDVTFIVASTTVGSEIYVNSKPDKAKVFFNDSEWYEPTNTSCVRDPGALKVRISLAGYEDWVEERRMGPGTTWKIEAELKKQK